MTTKIDRPLKRELSIRGKPYTLTIAPDALHLAPKGHRKGYELAWVDLVSGDAALATALNASVARGPKWAPETNAKAPTKSKTTRSGQKRSLGRAKRLKRGPTEIGSGKDGGKGKAKH